MSFPTLLSPLKMGPFNLRSRIAMAPMTRGRASPTHTANQLMADYYTQRAGAALIISEGAFTSVMARGWYHAPSIHTPEHVAGWRLTTDSVHAAGGLIFCQLWHSGRAGHSSFRDDQPSYQGDKRLAVAPSAIRRKSARGVQTSTNLPGEVEIETPRELLLAEIEAIPEEYRNAAQCAKDAGFDGIEIHSANGYLLDEFLQSCSNQRTDEYGGSFENRFRLLEKILRAVLTVFDAHSVAVRLSPNGVFNGMGSADFRESFSYYIKRLGEFDLGYLHVLDGLGFGFHNLGDQMTLEEIRKIYPGVIMGNCGYTPESAEKQIAAGNADLISFGRPYFSTPDFAERLAVGAALNEDADMSVYYSSVGHDLGEKGYTDFPKLSQIPNNH